VAEIALIHSVLGMTPGFASAADRLREAGHTVHVVDLFDGAAPLDSYELAAERVQKIGVPELVGRARSAVQSLPPDLVYGGFSLGAALSAGLAARRPGARGALLLQGAPNPASIGATSWPAGVPVQIHFALGDPGRNPTWIEELGSMIRTSGSPCDVFDYPGSGHIFTDASRPDEYDEASAELLWNRVFEFLRNVDAS
jgi:dienelactone hydrolase